MVAQEKAITRETVRAKVSEMFNDVKFTEMAKNFTKGIDNMKRLEIQVNTMYKRKKVKKFVQFLNCIF